MNDGTIWSQYSADQLEFDIYDSSRGRPNCQGKIAYRGPASPTSGGWPKIKLDLTPMKGWCFRLSGARFFIRTPIVRREANGQIASYEEAFGKKLRALGERTPPRDLYDPADRRCTA